VFDLCLLVVLTSSEILDNEKPKKRKESRRRLRKRYQIRESDDERCSQQKDMVNGGSNELVLQSEDDDSVPISSLYKSKTSTAKKTIEEVEGNADNETSETSNKKTEDYGNYVIEPTRKADNVVVGQPKFTIEKTTEEIEGKPDEVTAETSDKKAEVDGIYAIQPKRKAHDVFIDGQSKTTMNERAEEVDGRADKGTGETSYKGTELELPDTVMLPSTEVGHADGERPKKKRKQRDEEKTYEAESKHNNFVKEDKAQQNESNAENRVQYFPLRDEADNDK
jgi:FK506-binding nuclear protein